MSGKRPFDCYSDGFAEFAKRYESVSFEQVHGAWLHLLPPSGGLALDVGAGSGRDAAWLAERGWEVVAVEPATRLCAEAQRRHPSPRIRWLEDTLPGLEETHRLDQRFDLILLSAVWMHVAPRQRERAFRKLADLLKPGGQIVFTLRHGEPDPDRGMHSVDPAELGSLGRRFALEPVSLPRNEANDALGRPDVRWTTHVFRLPDDGTGALPLLRHIIINDVKSSTYKLALLRVLVRIADGARGMVLARDEEHVTLPFGLVALYWLRAFKPLVGAGKPPGQQEIQDGRTVYSQQANPRTGLGFVQEGFRSLPPISPQDFRIGGRFAAPDGYHLVRALRDICSNIRKMPATYTTLPGSDTPVFQAKATTVTPKRRVALTLDRETLRAFGSFKVPVHLWEAMSRYACWIEPAIVNEWCELMRAYDRRRGIERPMEGYRQALVWLDPQRDTARIRDRVSRLVTDGQRVDCVWTGRRLQGKFEIDHCFPFACWPNNDLWNLLPASPSANQKKSDRLPSARLLQQSADRILEWWEVGYGEWNALDQFRVEAFSSLPLSATLAGGREGGADLWRSVFAGLDNQRVRLRTDQQLAEWEG